MDAERSSLLLHGNSCDRKLLVFAALLVLAPQICSGLAEVSEFSSVEAIIPKDYWPNGIVPYEIDEGAHGFSSQQRFQIEDALKQMEMQYLWHSFSSKTDELDYVQFAKALTPSICYAIGAGFRNISDAERIYLGDECLSPANATESVMREMAHVLGLVGEQHRPDRDQYIEIVEKNILPDTLPQFVKLSTWLPTWQATDYDYVSITHYPTNVFSISPNRLDTIRLRQQPQTSALSSRDVGSSNYWQSRSTKRFG